MLKLAEFPHFMRKFAESTVLFILQAGGRFNLMFKGVKMRKPCGCLRIYAELPHSNAEAAEHVLGE